MASRKMTISKTKIAKSLSFAKAGSVKQLSLAAAFMFTATNVQALGLGSLEIKSSLDQPLNGQIELRVAPGEDAKSISAIIATREEFESLGIDYPDYLSDIRLSVSNEGGRSILLVNSNGIVIKEPFIHFLVRVEWSGGSFLREYTALIDPPVYSAETPQSESQPREVGSDQSYQSNTQDNSDVSSEAYDEVVSDSYSSGTNSGDARYGPVASGESLSVIASELQSQYPDLSIYQIMQVLFRENQNAFIGGNINGLIKGAVLNIGDLDTIRSVNVADSKEFFVSQVNQWDPSVLASSTDSDESINVGQDDYNDTEEDFSFDSIASDEDTERFQVGASSEENDFVSSDQGDNQEGEVLALRQEISQLETSLASSELEKQELNERISLLEGQLSDMNRLVDLNVESTDLAALESTLKNNSDAEGVVDELSSDAGSAIGEFLTDVEDSGDGLIDGASDVLDDAENGIDEFASDSTDSINEFLTDDAGIDETLDSAEEFGSELTDDLLTGDSIDGVTDSLDNTLDSAVDEIDSAIDEVEEVVAPKVAPAKVEKSMLEKVKEAVFGGGLWKILAGLGGLIMLGVGFLFWRNRRADEEFEISMLSIESNSESVSQSKNSVDDQQSMSMSQSVAEDDGGGDKETSFLTVYSDSDAVVQADEVDPVAEADVYIAYGRDEQAEEVLLDGIVSHPDRTDIKHKLLSLYHKRQNVEGFERVAEELYSQRDSLTGDMWQNVVEMGKEIAPHNPLFDLDGDDLSTATGAASVNLDGASNVDSDLDEVMTMNADSVSEAEIDELLDDESIQLVEVDADVDANLDDGDDDQEIEMDVLDFSDNADAKLEVDNELVDAIDKSDIAEVSLDDEVADDNILEFNVDDESNDDSLDFGASAEVSDLEVDADYDEARTQYELAKVFVDLGDEDGARKILDELVASSETSESVMADSKALLDSING